MSRCAHPNCGRDDVPVGRYACGPHWIALPFEIRDMISLGMKRSQELFDKGDRLARQHWAANSFFGIQLPLISGTNNSKESL